ncbi:lysine-rich nucleolar protein 1 [Prinia subflava]|uniref:lysine-rich nucleolar protein 1 n=1 Tax=Prinia subflava TaxID=208062 RepID=UPI002FE2D297
MIRKKKRKEFHEDPVQKKKKVKTIIEIEEDVQTVIRTEDNDHLKKKKKKKKENLKDKCSHKLQPKNNKKEKKKVSSEFLRAAHLESFVNIKGPVDLRLQEESEEQIKILKKKKKKVQCHFSLENSESSDMELSNHHEDGTKKNELPFKKKSKKTALDLELDGEVKKKRKRKGSYSLEDIHDSEQKQSSKVYKNTHKYLSQETVFMGKNSDTDNAWNDEESYVRRKKKKKNDKSDFYQYNMHHDPGSLTALSDSRKRKKHNSWEHSLTSREKEDKIKKFGTIKEKKKKRKDISSSACEEDNPDYSYSFLDMYRPAQQEVELEEEELSGKKHRKNFKDNNEVSKKKKKKREKETTYSKVSLNHDGAAKSKKILLENNKKKRKSEMERAQCVRGDTVDGTLCNSNPVQCDRKRKKGGKVPPQDFAEAPGSKADAEKIKTESPWNGSLEPLDGVIIVQEKKGNCDEISIDKVRRQALQEEIDRVSGKTKKAFSSKVGQDMKLGQWSTAAFGSSAEQMKFFRLMGGFKKGSVPIQTPSATTNKPNMALNKEGEEKLQQALKMEFDKAMDLKQHRGIGLGFQPTANKKVYIDKYASRSIKFED